MNHLPAASPQKPCLLRNFPALAVAATGLIFPSLSAAQEDKTNFAVVANRVVGMLQEHHLTGADFDGELPRKALKNYLNFLDFSKLYFIKPQVKQWMNNYEDVLDDEILLFNLRPAHEIHGVYAKAVTDRYEKIKALLEGGTLNFNSDQTVEISRKDADWPETLAELDELWRKEIIREVLLERINLTHAEERRKEKEAKKPKPEGKIEKKTPDTPEQKVLKRHKRYLDTLKETDNEDITNYLLSSIATAYDPHSEYLSAPERGQFDIEMRKELIGIGAVLQTKDGGAEIKQIVPSGPADKSGLIKVGDIIMGVAQGTDGEMEDIEGMKLQRTVEKIRGEANSTVRLKIQPADNPSITKEISIVREKVQMKDTLAKGELIEYTDPSKLGSPLQRTGWITLDSFYADMENRSGRSATGDVKKVLERLNKENIGSLVIDLRGNGGGSLEEAIKLTGLFVKRGTPVVQQKDDKDRIEHRVTRDNPVYNGPLLVLTDCTSASASEIFAAALQDCGRAVVAGDSSTFGKGTVQTIYDVRDQMPPFADKERAGSLKVTIAKFYRIAGGSTQREGVRPDIILPSRYDAMKIGERHLKYPLPYDTIPALTFDMAPTHPLPLKELAARSSVRIEKDPDMVFIRDYVKRTKEMLDMNLLSLNEKKRHEEDDANQGRNKAYKVERRQRVADVNKTGDPFKVYPVTLENVEDAQLKPDSEVKKEKPFSLTEEDESESDASDEDLFPHGFDPGKIETLRIARDLAELSAKNKATVKRN